MSSWDTCGVGLRPLTCCDCGFESRWVHGYLSIVSVVLSGIEICVGLITRPEKSYKCGVSECDRDSSTMKGPWPNGGCCAMVKRNVLLKYEGKPQNVWYLCNALKIKHRNPPNPRPKQWPSGRRVEQELLDLHTGRPLTECDYTRCCINPYPTAFPYGNGMVLHFYQQQDSSTTKTVHKVINKGLKTYV